MSFKIYNEDCMETMKRMGDGIIDIILTSPPYNTNKHAKGGKTLKDANEQNKHLGMYRYDSFCDNKTNEEYAEFTVNIFNEFDRILKPNGCVLYNMSYGTENTDCIFITINDILQKTNFMIADVICWKKKSAFPLGVCSNRLTRIWEFVFVFCRKSESKTFFCNKPVTSVRPNGQKMYGNIFNFIEAKNNDGTCDLNKATYSSELCEQLLNIYAKENYLVYDPFNGTGTTGVACINLNMDYIGSEISQAQCEYTLKRLNEKVKESNQQRLF